MALEGKFMREKSEQMTGYVIMFKVAVTDTRTAVPLRAVTIIVINDI